MFKHLLIKFIIVFKIYAKRVEAAVKNRKLVIFCLININNLKLNFW